MLPAMAGKQLAQVAGLRDDSRMSRPPSPHNAGAHQKHASPKHPRNERCTKSLAPEKCVRQFSGKVLSQTADNEDVPQELHEGISVAPYNDKDVCDRQKKCKVRPKNMVGRATHVEQPPWWTHQGEKLPSNHTQNYAPFDEAVDYRRKAGFSNFQMHHTELAYLASLAMSHELRWTNKHEGNTQR